MFSYCGGSNWVWVREAWKGSFIEHSAILYSAPAVCVKKPYWSLHMTINFCMVNKNVINDAYPMHRVEDQLEAMSGSSVFTMLDLTKGYHQMKLAESLKEITAFLSPTGLFQWKVLPISIKNFRCSFPTSYKYYSWESSSKMCSCVYWRQNYF